MRMENPKKFLFDKNIFDAPEKEEEPLPDLPPPPPVFSEEELAAAREVAFEQGRQKGAREERESREQFIAANLGTIADSFSRLFAAETLRENIFERESLRLSIQVLDLLFPLLNEKLGPEAAYKTIEKTLSDHRKTKEIIIRTSPGTAAEIETLIKRLREGEHEEALWKVIEDPALSPGDCALEWSDGGAVRDSLRAARDIRRNIESLLDAAVAPASHTPDAPPTAKGGSDKGQTDVLSGNIDESENPAGENA